MLQKPVLIGWLGKVSRMKEQVAGDVQDGRQPKNTRWAGARGLVAEKYVEQQRLKEDQGIWLR